MISKDRNLRQMSDTEYLALPGQGFQSASHNLGHCATDACVHFVKDQCRRLTNGCTERLEREHQPREFSAGSDLSQRENDGD